MPALALVPAAPPPVSAPAPVTYDFDESLQSRLLNLLMRDHQFATRSAGLIKPEYFTDETNGALCQLANEHFKAFNEPLGFSHTFGHVFKAAIASKKIRADVAANIKTKFGDGGYKIAVSDREFLLDQAAQFAKNRATEYAILASAEALAKGDYAKIEKLMKDALAVGVAKNSGTYDYYENIAVRTQHRKDLLAGLIKRTGITSGIPDFDKLLYQHGWGRKELAVLVAPPKGGKSMALADFGKSASLAKYKVIYFTLEVSAQIISDRLDANLADIKISDIGTSPIAVQTAIDKLVLSSGKFIIEEYASGSLKASDIRRRLDQHRADGLTFDMIIVDYGDLMAPENRGNKDRREWLSEIFIDLRGIAFEENAAVLTATQSNREGAKGAMVKATDVAEDFSKVMTADIVLTINSTADERLRGETRLFFAAARNAEDGFVATIKSDRSKMQFLKGLIGKSVP